MSESPTPAPAPVYHLTRAELPVFPWVGLASAIIGTMLAYMLIPGDIFKLGALFPSAVVMSVALLLPVGVAFWRNSKAILRVEHMVCFGIIYWLFLDLLQNAYAMSNVSEEGVTGAFIAVGLFMIGFWLSNLVPPFPLPRMLVRSTYIPMDADRTFQLSIVFFLLGMFNYWYASDFDFERMFKALLVNRWLAPWARSAYGGWWSFRDHMQYFGYVLPTLTAVIILRRGLFHPQTFVSLLMSVTIVAFLAQTGGRRLVGVTVGAAILFWMIASPKLNFRRILVAGSLFAGLLFFMQIILEYRDTGFIRSFYEDELTMKRSHVHVDDNILRLAQTIDLIPAQFPYVGAQRVVYTLVRPIPRALWEDKPTDPGFDLAKALAEPGVQIQYTTSVIGDWYMMYGFMTVFLGGLIYGRLSSMWSGLATINDEIVAKFLYALGAMAIFASLRNLDELVLQSYTILAWFVVSAMLAKRIPKELASELDRSTGAK
ncbi:MAG TPA: O-antigen polymerase [Gemmatales bacterium]|nr:O-antigen polymerase [Gemmatales bacterium]